MTDESKPGDQPEALPRVTSQGEAPQNTPRPRDKNTGRFASTKTGGEVKKPDKRPTKRPAGKPTREPPRKTRPKRTRTIRDDARPDDPERIGFLRRHWRRGEFTLEELQRITGFTAQEIAIIAEKEKFPPRVHARPVTSRSRSHWCGKTCPGLPRCPERGVMVSRLFGAVEREIARFEGQASDDLPATDFRVLGALTSTLDKLFALDRDFLRTPATDVPVQDHAHAQDPYDPDIAKRIRDAIAQALDGIGDKP